MHSNRGRLSRYRLSSAWSSPPSSSEVGVPYELRFIDILTGEQKQPELLSLNRMGKLPTLTDGDMVITESAAIGLYLADRYAPGKLAPALDDPRRGTYLRWSLFAPSVIEPAVMAKAGGWQYRESAAGWGAYDAMIEPLSGSNALVGRLGLARSPHRERVACSSI